MVCRLGYIFFISMALSRGHVKDYFIRPRTYIAYYARVVVTVPDMNGFAPSPYAREGHAPSGWSTQEFFRVHTAAYLVLHDITYAHHNTFLSMVPKHAASFVDSNKQRRQTTCGSGNGIVVRSSCSHGRAVVNHCLLWCFAQRPLTFFFAECCIIILVNTLLDENEDKPDKQTNNQDRSCDICAAPLVSTVAWF